MGFGADGEGESNNQLDIVLGYCHLIGFLYQYERHKVRHYGGV